MTAVSDWVALAACATVADPSIFFPERADGEANHGADAKLVCARCPVRTDCLVESLVRNEDGGIWGGAGEMARRWILRKWRQRTHPDGYRPGCSCAGCTAISVHFARLDGHHVGPVNANGPGATHGLRVTYARGCRCDGCCLAAGMGTAEQKFTNRRRTA